MSTLENVTVIKKANLYFDGAVSSRTINFPDGSHKTLGLMNVGEYTFNAGDRELMEILGGNCEVKLEGSDTWNAYSEGKSFDVPANSAFDIKVLTPTDYCCSYFK